MVSGHRPGLFWYNTGWRPAKPGKLRKYDRLIIDVTYNQLMRSGSIKSNPWRSFGCNINTMWDIPITNGNTVSLGIGLAYKYQKTGPKGLFFADSSNSFTHYYADSSYSNYRKNTFGNHILALPVEFRFRTPKWQHFKMHIGGSIGYRLQTFQKVWPEHKHAVKDLTLPDVNRLDRPMRRNAHLLACGVTYDVMASAGAMNLKTSVDEVQRSPNAGRLRIWH